MKVAAYLEAESALHDQWLHPVMACPICDYADAVILPEPMSDSLRIVDCMTCVDYRLVGIGLTLTDEMRLTRHLMAGLLAERKIRGEEPMEIRRSQWSHIVSTAPSTFTEQVDRLLVNLSKKSSEGGVMTSLSSGLHCPWAFAAAKDSFVYRLRTLANSGWIEMQGSRGEGGSDWNDLGFVLTYSVGNASRNSNPMLFEVIKPSSP